MARMNRFSLIAAAALSLTFANAHATVDAEAQQDRPEVASAQQHPSTSEQKEDPAKTPSSAPNEEPECH